MSPQRPPEGSPNPEEGNPENSSADQNLPSPAAGTGGIVDVKQKFEVRGQSIMGLSGENGTTSELVQIVPVLRDYWKNVGAKRLGELYWLQNKEGDEPVDDIADHFRRIVFILMGRRLGGFIGQRVTPEGKGRIELLVQFLKLGVLNPEEFDKAIFAFSGHGGEAQAFFAHFLVNAMESELQWTNFRKNMHMDTDAAFSNENILFSHDDIVEDKKYEIDVGKGRDPVLWIVCSTDFHIQSLLIAHASCKGQPGSPLAPLLESENRGDRLAFLSAPNPYRHSTDPGVRASQRIMESTFYFGQAILNNLGSLLDTLDPEFSLRTVQNREGESVPLRDSIPKGRLDKLERSLKCGDRYSRRIYPQAVQLFQLLPSALEYCRDRTFPERQKKRWEGTHVGPRLTEIDNALSELDFSSLRKGKNAQGRYQGTFGTIVSDLEEAVQDGEGVTLPQIYKIFNDIRERIIEDIRHWGDPENTLKQPKP